jgi:lysophospholipase L1-like esterase
MQYKNVYWDVSLMNNDGKLPSILAIGDSWFWYPFPGGSLVNYLGELLGPREHVILAYGNNGAEAYDYVHGTYSRQITTALDLYGDRLSAVFISGGGNDFSGISDLRPMLGDNCAACTTAAACFRDGAEKGSLDWLLGKVKDSYIALINQVIGATWRTGVRPADGGLGSATGATRIILHNYDYAPVTGVGIFGPNSSPWLRPAFEAAGVAGGLRDECIEILINRFTKMLKEVVARYPGRVVLVDSRGALQRADWANELHPTPAGFRKIAARWEPVLHSQGLA